MGRAGWEAGGPSWAAAQHRVPGAGPLQTAGGGAKPRGWDVDAYECVLLHLPGTGSVTLSSSLAPRFVCGQVGGSRLSQGWRWLQCLRTQCGPGGQSRGISPMPCVPLCPAVFGYGLGLEVKLQQPSHGATTGQPFLLALLGGCSLGLLSDSERLHGLWHRQALQRPLLLSVPAP